MTVLGVETSCDETAVALVSGGRLLGQELASQSAHAVFGGVVPEIACREHLRLLPRLFDRLMQSCGAAPAALRGVAVSRGPGLLGSLLVGLSFAKGLCLATGAALVGVNHLHAHLLAPGLERELVFPALGLLASGGHTHLYLLRSATDFELLGRTLDDAAGEAFDKAAKMLNLPYPGGRFLDEIGACGRADPRLFPRPYLDNDNLDFSFSGLKTAMSVLLKGRPELVFPAMAGAAEVEAAKADPVLAGICASFNLAVAETLRAKTERALSRRPEARALIVAGGVAANSVVRRTMAGLAASRGLELILPSPGLCTDNAAMVACAGERLLDAGLRHGLGLDAVPRGRQVPWDYLGVR